MKLVAIKTLKFCAFVGIFVALYWYATNAVGDTDKLDRLIIALTLFGVTYGISKPLFEAVSEIVGGIMVIAEFLNRHLLEPQKQRLLEQGRKQAREAARAEADARLDKARARLKELGLDPSDILPADDPGETRDQA
ncbi:MAG: hypothetical protein OXE87_06025 [Chloroflexi bacterium]|nr:hypothetical protein [Chloroflexota bacterium]